MLSSSLLPSQFSKQRFSGFFFALNRTSSIATYTIIPPTTVSPVLSDIPAPVWQPLPAQPPADGVWLSVLCSRSSHALLDPVMRHTSQGVPCKWTNKLCQYSVIMPCMSTAEVRYQVTECSVVKPCLKIAGVLQVCNYSKWHKLSCSTEL